MPSISFSRRWISNNSFYTKATARLVLTQKTWHSKERTSRNTTIDRSPLAYAYFIRIHTACIVLRIKTRRDVKICFNSRFFESAIAGVPGIECHMFEMRHQSSASLDRRTWNNILFSCSKEWISQFRINSTYNMCLRSDIFSKIRLSCMLIIKTFLKL